MNQYAVVRLPRLPERFYVGAEVVLSSGIAPTLGRIESAEPQGNFLEVGLAYDGEEIRRVSAVDGVAVIQEGRPRPSWEAGGNED